MKRLIAFSLLVSLFISCISEPENTMTVTGTVKGLKKGTLYLQHIADSNLVTIDSIQIKGTGDFTFNSKLDSPEVFYLYLKKQDNNEINDRITFFGEPGTITIKTVWNRFENGAEISGSESHKKLEEYKDVMSKFNSKNIEILQGAYELDLQQDSLAVDSIQKLSDKNVLRGYLYALNFALNNRDSHIAPYIALTEVADANVKYLDSIYRALTPEVASSKYGKALAAYVEEVKSLE